MMNHPRFLEISEKNPLGVKPLIGAAAFFTIFSFLGAARIVPAANLNPDDGFTLATGFELSGVARVAGSVLMADDELVGSVLFFEKNPDGKAPARAQIVKFQRGRKMSAPIVEGKLRLFPGQDIEGLASDGKNTVFVLGSHGTKRKKRKFSGAGPTGNLFSGWNGRQINES